jgi:hypothetical protein
VDNFIVVERIYKRFDSLSQISAELGARFQQISDQIGWGQVGKRSVRMTLRTKSDSFCAQKAEFVPGQKGDLSISASHWLKLPASPVTGKTIAVKPQRWGVGQA